MNAGKMLTLNDRMKFNVLIIHQISGGGLKRLGHFLLKKQSVVRIRTNKDDSLCALRAVIVGKGFADKCSDYNVVRDSRNNLQTCLSINLANELGFDINKSLGIEDLIKVEKFLKDYQLIIINGDLMSEFSYVGDYRDKKIILFYHNNHFLRIN